MSVSGTQKRIPVVHIGMPKTATKTLQWRLFANHSEIYYLGRFDGQIFSGKYRNFDACRNKTIQSVMKQIAYDDIYNPNFLQCKELLQEALAPAIEQNLLPVWSWESYSTDILAKRRVRARNLKKVFGEAKIIMTLRNPIALLESAYFQVLQRENVGACGNKGCSPFYLSIDEWLKTDYNGEILPHLKYAETIQIYVEQFGLENVSVFLFEDLVANKYTFLKNICDVIGINSEEGLRLMDQKTDNERWKVGHIESLIKIQRSFIKSFKFKYSNKNTRKAMLGLQGENISIIDEPKAKAPISVMWQNKIFEEIKKGNHWIEEQFNLPLKKYGYYGVVK